MGGIAGRLVLWENIRKGDDTTLIQSESGVGCRGDRTFSAPDEKHSAVFIRNETPSTLAPPEKGL